jgi:hypothetical protein
MATENSQPSPWMRNETPRNRPKHQPNNTNNQNHRTQTGNNPQFNLTKTPKPTIKKYQQR